MNYDLNDPLIKEIIEKTIEDPSEVEKLIFKINDTIINSGIIYRKCATEVDDAIRYFTSGHCNIYAEILYRVLGDYMQAYDNNDHIVSKIGDVYYDFNGLYDITKSETKFRLYDNKYLLEPMYCILGNYDKEEDLPIISVGEAAGKKYIYDKAYGLSSENSSITL